MALDLACEGRGIGVVWVGGFDDSAVSHALGVDWEMEIEALLILLGAGYWSGSMSR